MNACHHYLLHVGERYCCDDGVGRAFRIVEEIESLKSFASNEVICRSRDVAASHPFFTVVARSRDVEQCRM